MKIMLDMSPSEIVLYRAKYDHDFWQLRTPLTAYGLSGFPYGLDNGCFSRFERRTWERMLNEAKDAKPVFVCLPDIVCDARRTMELFEHFKKNTIGLPRALVLQDGIGNHDIPWDDISAVFVGGSDRFKISTEAVNACKTAKMMGKWVHVGRVNTPNRASNWLGLADSIDGSGISQYDHMLDDVLATVIGNARQKVLI